MLKHTLPAAGGPLRCSKCKAPLTWPNSLLRASPFLSSLGTHKIRLQSSVNRETSRAARSARRRQLQRRGRRRRGILRADRALRVWASGICMFSLSIAAGGTCPELFDCKLVSCNNSRFTCSETVRSFRRKPATSAPGCYRRITFQEILCVLPTAHR